MTKQEHIAYWLTTAEDDWKRTQLLFESKDYVFALFCAHLSVEKTIKACWVRDNVENTPPKIHNLKKLIEQTKVVLSAEHLELLTELNRYQLEGRYPDYKNNLFKFTTREFYKDFILQLNEIKKCLLENLQ